MDAELIEREFEQELIRTRKGRSGTQLSYVETPEYIRRLNQVFDYNWSFEIEEERIESVFVVVRGRLTAEGVAKVQYGSSQLTVSKQTGELVSVGDDYKAAGSDCLKKCSSLFGIGLHLYSSDNSGMGTMSPNRGNGRITKSRLGRIKTLRTKAGISSDDVLDLVERMFNTRDVVSINREMASAVIAVLEYKNGDSEESEEEVV